MADHTAGGAAALEGQRWGRRWRLRSITRTKASKPALSLMQRPLVGTGATTLGGEFAADLLQIAPALINDSIEGCFMTGVALAIIATSPHRRDRGPVCNGEPDRTDRADSHRALLRS
jgi:hypothetical protein